jgi:citrate lyase beta subunit
MNLIQNYFFVPANKPQFLEKSLKLAGVDFRILDFEDSVSASNIENALQTVQTHELRETDWVRIPVIDQFKEIANELFKLNLTNVVIPKVRDKEHFDEVLNQLIDINDKTQVIILIENAKIYLQLEEILKKWNKYIVGVGLGSHDFSAATKIRHNTKELFPLRLQISLLANAYGVVPIDIASMNISDKEGYETEIQSAYDLGYRAKFVLHPFQLHLLKEYPFFSIEEVDDASHVLELFTESEQNKEVVLKYKGKIYEKPHVEKLKSIKAWGNQFYGTDR